LLQFVRLTYIPVGCLSVIVVAVAVVVVVVVVVMCVGPVGLVVSCGNIYIYAVLATSLQILINVFSSISSFYLFTFYFDLFFDDAAKILWESPRNVWNDGCVSVQGKQIKDTLIVEN